MEPCNSLGEGEAAMATAPDAWRIIDRRTEGQKEALKAWALDCRSYRQSSGNAGANKGVLGVVRRDVTPIANTAMTVEQEI